MSDIYIQGIFYTFNPKVSFNIKVPQNVLADTTVNSVFIIYTFSNTDY